jgi:hypothetical protein
MSSEIKQNRSTTLCLTVKKDQVQAILPLLAQGFTIKTKIGYSVEEFLCNQLGLSSEYVEHRIQTIFLNGKAVDNVKTAMILEGSTLALSAAMPGLAGATLRRGGAYAAMRQKITHKINTKNHIVKDGSIVLKLFNLVARDIGPTFLLQGILISGKNLQYFFRKAPDHFWAGCLSVEIDGKHSEVEKLAHIDWKQKLVFLKLEF